MSDDSLDRWRKRIAIIQKKHGLISFIVHSDYIIPERARKAYCILLEYLASLRDHGGAWFALPGEVESWWRQRAAMQLVLKDGQWAIEGPGSERARAAFVHRGGTGVTYTVSR